MENNFSENMIAACGLNCAVCVAHLREKNKCADCNADSEKQPHCSKCVLRNCENRNSNGRFCFECNKFPCARMKQINKRYTVRYETSLIANLEFIRDKGMEKFLQEEKKKWLTDQGVRCIHNKKVYKMD